MIAVIADDFTGAAELAGISRRYQLKVALCLGVAHNTKADIIIISTDSRSKSLSDALQATRIAIESLLPLHPQWIYKKTDSVLRGYVVEELLLQLKLQKKRKALLLPANPSLGRTIKESCYFINDVPIHQTNFSIDPEFAILDPTIHKMLKAQEKHSIQYLKCGEWIKDQSSQDAQIYVGEIENQQDLQFYIQQAEESMVIAGAGDAFEVLLMKYTSQRYPLVDPIFFPMELPALYINGSKFNDSLVNYSDNTGANVFYFSSNVLSGKQDLDWYAAIQAHFLMYKKVLLAIDDQIVQSLQINPLVLRNTIAGIVKKLIEQFKVNEIFIEGGSTAAAILDALNLQYFTPTEEISRGVIRMFAPEMNLYITVKPGSYQLPKCIVNHFLN